MANTLTYTNIYDRAVDLCDMTGSNFVSTSLVFPYINAARHELYDMLIMANEDYLLSTKTDTITSSNAAYTLVSVSATTVTGNIQDFYKLRKVWQTYQGRRYVVPLASDSDMEMAETTFSESVPVEIWYIPQLSPTTTAANYVSDGFGILPSGWDDFLVLSAAIRIGKKAEYDVRPWENDLAVLRQRIIGTASVRDSGDSPAISDIYQRFNNPESLLYKSGRPQVKYRLMGNAIRFFSLGDTYGL